MTCLVTACDSGGGGYPTAPATSGGLVNSMASGVAAGVGMGVGSHLAGHAINKWQNRRSGSMRSFRRR